MSRNVKEVKEEFLKVCREFDIQEVYVNFDNPFSEVHESRGEKLYVVPNLNQVDSGVINLEFVFAPNLRSDDEDIVMSVDLCIGEIREEGIAKKEKLQHLIKKGFKKLYSSKEGICFG